MEAQKLSPFSEADYWVLDAGAGEGLRYEYWGGWVVAMAGAEPEHNEIKDRISRHLGNQLEARRCLVVTSDQRVCLPGTEQEESRYVYPDVVVTCAVPVYQRTIPRTLLNPTLLVEVASPSTGATDRGRKLEAYRKLSSLQEYWIAESGWPHIERWYRSGNHWHYEILFGTDAVLRSGGLEVVLPLEDLYRLTPGRMDT
jgi:Uma2 family endonuclease